MTPARPPERRALDEQVARRERQRAAVDRLADRGEQLVRAVGDAAADDDERRVEEVDDAREHRADPPARVAGAGATATGSPNDAARATSSAVTVAALVERGPEPRAAAVLGGRLARPAERRATGQRLEAADVAAAADDRRIVGDLDVADVAGTPLRAAMEVAVRDDPGPDARPDLDDDHVVVAGRDAGSPLARGRGR